MFSCTREEKEFSCCLPNCSAAVYLILYVYIDRQSYPEIRYFKEIQMTNSALPQRQHSLNFLSGDCKAVYVATLSVRMGWRNSGMWRDRAWRWLQAWNTLTPPIWRSATAESAFLLHVLSSTHSHWAMPSIVTQELAARDATSHCFYGAIPFVQRRLGGVIWGH